MQRTSSFSRSKRTAVAALILACGVIWSLPARADPPPWAPAWGHHKKHNSKNWVRNRYGSNQNRYGSNQNRYGWSQNRYGSNQNSYNSRQAYVAPNGIGQGRCNRDMIGGLMGGAAGGLLGAQIGSGKGQLAAVAAGTLLGFMVGNSIGRSMDAADQSCMTQSLEHAEDGQSIVWDNPQSGASYQVTPTRTIQVAENRYCREYTTTSTIGGKTATTYGRACRQPDGSWQITN